MVVDYETDTALQTAVSGEVIIGLIPHLTELLHRYVS
jgi:hypothetical protein